MDSFGTLLSPIDNFEFSTHFHGAKLNSESHAHMIQKEAPPSNDWHDLLDGPQFDNFVTDFLGAAPMFHPPTSQATPPVWRSDMYRSLSETFTDSPASSYTSSSSCSPWVNVPGLALGYSPEFVGFDDLTAQYPPSLYFPSSEDLSSQAFKGLSLGSPIRLTCSNDDPNSLVNAPNDLPEPLGLFDNALALHFSADTFPDPQDSLEQSVHPSSSQNLLPPYGNVPATALSDNILPNDASLYASAETAAASGSIADYDFASIANVNCARPARTPPPTASPASLSFLSVDPCAGTSTGGALMVRASRRRSSRIDYSEVGYEGDSDDERDDDYAAEDAFEQQQQQHGSSIHEQQPRTLKKKKSRTFSSRESDDEDDSETGMGGARRSGTRVGGGRRVVSGASTSSQQRKAKRRHLCIKPGCSSTFTRITDMERHVASVHRGVDTDENRCRFCTKAFSRDDAVLRHENDSCPARPKKVNAMKMETWV